ETTLYTVLLSGFYLTLSSLTGQRDLVVGTPSDNRHHEQTQDLVGFFVNSLALRCYLPEGATIETVLPLVHEIVNGAKAHQELPFEQVIELLSVPREGNRHPFYQVSFSLDAFDDG